MPRANPDVNYEISIHALLAESDRSLLLPVRGSRISIHALLAESDHTAPKSRWSTGSFLSTLSLRRATVSISHQPRGTFVISIHALLAESDKLVFKCGVALLVFLSTLSLRRATYMYMIKHINHIFLSTLSLRRATFRSGHHTTRYRHFYPRSPCGERLSDECIQMEVVYISIHALLAESDWNMYEYLIDKFISIHALLAESDPRRGTADLEHCISIHALLAESDPVHPGHALPSSFHFYPRSPCGERLPHPGSPRPVVDISIHALLAESDCGCIRYNSQHPISIHALLAESDAAARIWLARRRYFYPRSPCGERHCLLMVRLAAWAFLSTLSLRRATVAPVLEAGGS